ncbi:hypothetical protein OESDEN_24548 [Oesophagostomum dentatum]|uniref:Uncharacterized protein n=1 Tax=Oesophagostomum dentatum TaxID=61180 RepID=A0A0B1RXT8_OESDE|nr:hypothetical protein OESDEN_24548 [Oesophagostomum dentatum]
MKYEMNRIIKKAPKYFLPMLAAEIDERMRENNVVREEERHREQEQIRRRDEEEQLRRRNEEEREDEAVNELVNGVQRIEIPY